jgi:hypothetical protein
VCLCHHRIVESCLIVTLFFIYSFTLHRMTRQKNKQADPVLE